MSEIAAAPEIQPRERTAKLPRGGVQADHALVQLTLVRFREFVREPEALFWVFVFPILLAAGLGLGLSQPAGGRAEDRHRDAGTGADRCGRKSCSTCS